jgi:hypothetical protein
MKLFISFLLFIFISGCTSKDPILGTWERYGDQLKGMRIKVTQNSSTINAEVIKLPDNGNIIFTIGDIKWKDVKKVDNGKYIFGDLFKYQESYGTLFQN